MGPDPALLPAVAAPALPDRVGARVGARARARVAARALARAGPNAPRSRSGEDRRLAALARPADLGGAIPLARHLPGAAARATGGSPRREVRASRRGGDRRRRVSARGGVREIRRA